MNESKKGRLCTSTHHLWYELCFDGKILSLCSVNFTSEVLDGEDSYVFFFPFLFLQGLTSSFIMFLRISLQVINIQGF